MSSIRTNSLIAKGLLVLFVILEMLVPLVFLLHVSMSTLEELAGNRILPSLMIPSIVNEAEETLQWALKVLGLLLLVKLSLAGATLIGIVRDSRTLRRGGKATALPLLTPSARFVHESIMRVATAMEVPLEQLVVHKDGGTRSASPTITEVDGKIHLVIPTGAMLVASADRPAFEAMIAHEFAHVRQGDGTAWGLAEGARVHLKRYLDELGVGFLAVGALVYWLQDGAITDVSVARILPCVVVAAVFIGPSLVITFLARAGIVTMRRRSELAADRWAARVVGAEALRTAIANYSLQDQGTSDSDSDEATKELARSRSLIAELHGDIDVRLDALRAEP